MQVCCIHHIVGKTSPQSTTTCEGIDVQLECEEGFFLRIESAFYGRLSNDTCARADVVDLNCQSNGRELSIMRPVCEGRRSCWLMPINAVFGDTCPDNYKMGSVEYTCQSKSNTFVYTCRLITTVFRVKWLLPGS